MDSEPKELQSWEDDGGAPFIDESEVKEDLCSVER